MIVCPTTQGFSGSPAPSGGHIVPSRSPRRALTMPVMTCVSSGRPEHRTPEQKDSGPTVTSGSGRRRVNPAASACQSFPSVGSHPRGARCGRACMASAVAALRGVPWCPLWWSSACRFGRLVSSSVRNRRGGAHHNVSEVSTFKPPSSAMGIWQRV